MPGLSAAKRRKLTRDESPSSEGPPRLSLSQLATRFAPSPALSQDVKPKVEGTEWPEVYVEVKPAFDEVKEDRPTYQPNTPAVKTEDSSTDTSVGGSPPTPVDVKPIIKSEGDVCSSAVGSDASINLFADKRAAALAIRERKKLEVASKKQAEEQMKRLAQRERGQRKLAEMGINSPMLQSRLNLLVNSPAPQGGWQPHKDCSPEQLDIIRRVRSGQNVFFSGSAGTGKSFVISQLREMLMAENINYSVTSPTGISALQIGGTTIHSWARVGLANQSTFALIDMILDKRSAAQRWCDTAVLIIDEISMLQPSLFQKLNLIGKAVRGNDQAFGGIQLIVSGDFFQLPPVGSEKVCLVCNDAMFEKDGKYFCAPDQVKGKKGCGAYKTISTFCFQTETWAEANFKHILLTKVFRQADPKFAAVLNKIRRGICDEEVSSTLLGCARPIHADHKIKPTRLEPRNADVENENRREYEKVDAKEHLFTATDAAVGFFAQQVQKERVKDLRAPTCLALKEGAQVMLLANVDLLGGLANGSRGVIVGFEEPNEPDEDVMRQYDNSARARLMADAERDWISKQDEPLLPRVLFANGVEAVVRPWVWQIELDKDNLITRCQLPFMLAWAVTIHKCQASTLDAVTCNLRGVWDAGQSYVCLSRSRLLSGMQVENFHPDCIKVAPEVLDFYDHLPTKLPTAPLLMHVIDYAMPPALLKDNVTKPLRPRHQLAVKRPFYNPTLIIPGAPLAMDVDVKLGVKQEAIDIKPADGVKLIDVDDEEVKPVIDPTPIDLTASSPAAEPAPIEEERPYWQKTLSEAFALFSTLHSHASAQDFLVHAATVTTQPLVEVDMARHHHGKRKKRKSAS